MKLQEFLPVNECLRLATLRDSLQKRVAFAGGIAGDPEASELLSIIEALIDGYEEGNPDVLDQLKAEKEEALSDLGHAEQDAEDWEADALALRDYILALEAHNPGIKFPPFPEFHNKAGLQRELDSLAAA
jgi:hypothetical protein